MWTQKTAIRPGNTRQSKYMWCCEQVLSYELVCMFLIRVHISYTCICIFNLFSVQGSLETVGIQDHTRWWWEVIKGWRFRGWSGPVLWGSLTALSLMGPRVEGNVCLLHASSKSPSLQVWSWNVFYYDRDAACKLSHTQTLVDFFFFVGDM
jgi:hypothetical protein